MELKTESPAFVRLDQTIATALTFDDVLLVPAAGAQKGDEWWLGALERAPHVQGLFPST